MFLKDSFFRVVKKSGLCDKVSLTSTFSLVNSLPNNKILDWSKLKALADYKIKVTENFKIILGKVESIVRKGENAGYQHLHLFPQCF